MSTEPSTPANIPVPAIGHRPDVQRRVAPFEVVSEYSPSGDQPTAIAEIARRLDDGEKDVVLLGATGTGKSATTAWLIECIACVGNFAKGSHDGVRVRTIVKCCSTVMTSSILHT